MFSLDKKKVLWVAGGVVTVVLVVGIVWVWEYKEKNNLHTFGLSEGRRINNEQRGVKEQSGQTHECEKKGGSGHQDCGINKQGQGQRQESGNGVQQGNCINDEELTFDDTTPVKELSAEAKNALDLAIADEYKARATYASIMSKFGSIRPFSKIILAEEQHIIALKSMYDRYGVAVPADTTSNIPSFASKEDACKAGVSAEVANASLYKETLLPKVKEYEDITQVFTHLMDASQENHLPAFERCQ